MKASLFDVRVKFVVRFLLIFIVCAIFVNLQSGLSEAANNLPLPAQGPQSEISQLQQAQCLNSGQARQSTDATTGLTRFVGTDPSKPIRSPIALATNATAEDAARGYLSACGSLFGLGNQATQLAVSQLQTADGGRSFVRFNQVHQGIPVLAGESIVQLDSAKNILSVTSKTAPNLSVNPTPTISAETARQSALQAVAKTYQTSLANLAASQPQVWVYSPALLGSGTGTPSLVWRIEVTTKVLNPIRELVLVDAQHGGVTLHFNQADGALQLRTYTANDTNTVPGTLVCTEADPSCASGDADAKDAHQFATDTYNYFFNTFGRDSLDGAGIPITSTVRYSSTIFIDTLWNGSEVIYGNTYHYPHAEDLVGHELTHGVIQYTANLYNYYQSGSVAESIADVFGEFIQQTYHPTTPGNRWLIGENVPGLGAVRNMADPAASPYLQPDKMTSANYDTRPCQNSTDNCDNGQVHQNSGVGNKAAFLMTDGGVFNAKTVTGLGMTKVARIYYEVMTHLLVSGSDYSDLYNALYQGCLNLVNTNGITSGDCQQVRNATDAVEMNLQPVFDYNPKAPICNTGTPNNIFFDNFESGLGNWVTGATLGTNRWGLDSTAPYAFSGLHSLYANDSPGAITDSTAAMKTSVTLPANAFLYFANAFGFENSLVPVDYFDGGIVEYSITGGSTWTDARTLFDANGYNGIIHSGNGNPLSARNAFVGDSHGYNTSRLNLNTLALIGQSIRFRWRMGLDNSVSNQGWWIDDVRIYTCTPAALPGAFGKISPTNGAMAQPVNPTLTWGASATADSYEYCYDTTNDNTCNSGIWVTTGSTLSAHLAGLSNGTTYYWQVRARNSSGTTEADTGSWSSLTTSYFYYLPFISK